ncbi:MAG: hypothetical protein AAF485_32540 [Chloroflexota bacterium]
MKNVVMVTFGDREFELKRLPARKMNGFRKGVSQTALDFIDIIRDLLSSDILGAFDNETPLTESFKSLNLTTLASQVPQAYETINKALEIIPDLVVEYMKSFTSDKDIEFIDENGLDSEFLTAFWEVVQFAYPLLEMFGATSPNGDSEPSTS